MQKIRRVYPSLRRSLDLEGPTFAPVLLDECVPVVTLHEHCEGDFFTGNGGVAGVTAAETDLFTPLRPGRAGAYCIVAQFYGVAAIALVGTTEVVTLMVRPVGSAAGAGRSILRWDFSNDSMDRPESIVIPKLHLEENVELAMVLRTALIANDQAYGLLLVQPL